MGSWYELGQPVVWNEDVAEAVRLLNRLYELCPGGGPLHVVVEDWNIDDDYITPMYEIPARGSIPGYPDHHSAEVHEVCDRLAAMLSEMPVGWRGSVLAHQDGRAVEGTVVRRTPRLVAPGVTSPTEPAPLMFLIWSNEHGAWWKPDRWGYTLDCQQAGRYDAEMALAIVATHGACGPHGPNLPNEVAVLAPELRWARNLTESPDTGETPCNPVSCPDFDDVTLTIQEWVPTLAELRQAGAAIAQPDGSFYVERDGQVVRISAEEAAGR